MTQVVIDCTELYQNPVRTGIQRVVRELLSHWPHDDVEVRVARFDPAQGLVPLHEQAIKILTDQERGAAAMSRDALVKALRRVGDGNTPLPRKPAVFIPELFFDAARCRFYEGQQPAMLAYDFLPWLRPDLFATSSVVGLMPYLRLLDSASRVAYISEQTMREHEARIARRATSGIVLPLGADGLRIERQAWHGGRAGYLSLGSLDTRKNQHLIVEAFIRLWENGSEIPLTLIGRAFEGHKFEWLRAAQRYPYFRWLDNAADADVAKALRGVRATIYVSEAEGYGLPPVESLAVGVPVIAAASCPSVDMLKSVGVIRLAPVGPDQIAAAVVSLEDDATAAALWRDAAMAKLATWRDFAQATANWLKKTDPATQGEITAGETTGRRPLAKAALARLDDEHSPEPIKAKVPEPSVTGTPMNFTDMYAWWNKAALENPMTAILSNHQNWDGDAFFETGKVWLAESRVFMEAANVKLGGKRALDFGCGVGRMTAALHEMYDNVVGVDISEEMIRLARQLRRHDNVEFVQVAKLPLPFANREFDCIYSTIVVQHIPSPFNLDYVKEFFRISTDIVIFDAPSHLRPGMQPGAGIFLLDHRSVFKCAEEAGFEPIGLRDFPATDTRQYQYLFRRYG